MKRTLFTGVTVLLVVGAGVVLAQTNVRQPQAENKNPLVVGILNPSADSRLNV
jgi:hypothetical protein